jgi:hypothetical protein
MTYSSFVFPFLFTLNNYTTFLYLGIGSKWSSRKHFRRDGEARFEKTKLKPHLRQQWCIPPEEDGAFVAAMEDILDLYSQPYDENHPVVCMDEKPYQLL